MASTRKPVSKKSGKKTSSKKWFDLQKFLHYFYWVLAVVSALGAAGVVGFYAGYNQARDESACVITEHKNETRKLRKEMKRL